jgi:beta-xylosidase
MHTFRGSLQAAEAQAPRVPLTQFQPDQAWLDDNGVHINAHGGGLLFHEGTYYWFGEHKISGDAAEVGVHCYSSVDLYNWKDRGVALSVSADPQSEIVKGCIIERPKVIYNATTRKFVMWFHLELKGNLRKSARSGIAVSDSPTGPYQYLRSVRPNAGTWPLNVTEEQKTGLTEAQKLIGTSFIGSPHPDRAKQNLLARDFLGGQMAKDMTLFVDDDGKAYHVFSSEENSTLHIAQLSDDYLSHSGKWTRVFCNEWLEAPALCKFEGRYWLIASNCTGWCPNAARSAVASSIWGPWQELGNPCVGAAPGDRLGPNLSFGGQSTFILPVNGKPGAFIALFDIWRPEDHLKGTYMWLPMKFERGRFTIIWRDAWDLSVFKSSDRPKR